MSQIENELETSRLLRDWYRIHKGAALEGVFRPLYHLDIRDNPSTNTGGARDGLFSPFYRTVPGCGFAGFGGGRRGVEILAGLGYYSRARNLHAAAKILWNVSVGYFLNAMRM